MRTPVPRSAVGARLCSRYLNDSMKEKWRNIYIHIYISRKKIISNNRVYVFKCPSIRRAARFSHSWDLTLFIAD